MRIVFYPMLPCPSYCRFRVSVSIEQDLGALPGKHLAGLFVPDGHRCALERIL